jgi:phage terminase large subunit-like protein
MRKQDKEAVERYQKKIEFAKTAGAAPAFVNDQEKADIIERCKKDPAFMVQYFFPHYATAPSADFHIEFAQRVKKYKTYKGFAQWGRALAKSVWNDVIIPFWLWLCGEDVYLVIIGNSKDRASQLLEDLQAEFEVNPRIIAHFGEQKNLGNWEAGFFITKSGFIGQALGMGQSVRGLRVGARRPTHIVCDDIETREINKNPKRQNEIAKWIEKDLLGTMDGPIRRFIQANNRFAPRMIQTILQEKHPGWDVHQVNAYDPITYEPRWKGKYPPEYYRQLESADEGMGLYAALAEYNNQPHIEGEIFKPEQVQWAKLPALNHFKMIVGHWDIAYAGSETSDYNAVVIMGLKDKEFWYIDSFCKQTKMRQAVVYMCDVQKNLPETVIIHWRFEAQFWNDEVERTIDEVCDELKVYLNITKVDTPRGSKYDRILTLQPRFQNGRIYFNDKKKAHKDTVVGEGQLYGIEPGYTTHDDWPDAKQQAIEFLQKHIPMGNNTGNYQSGTMLPNNERI